ncbi:RICIN domain-containing protein [Microbacteriaceae bacterium VKM Ac-2855]|nr:RICIN domain-containing protein [Microbacteriaceae bacterium VKM Ac-2855]
MKFSRAKKARGGWAALLIGAIAAAVLVPSLPAAAVTASYWVDAANGSDSNTGTSSSQAFRSLARAQTAVRAVAPSMSDDVIVNVRSGTYTQTSALTFSAADSGTNGHTVRWQAAPGESPIISGARSITGWSSAGNGVFKASVGSLAFRQLYVNGVHATRSRFPDQGSWFQLLSTDPTGKTVTVPSSALNSSVTAGTEMMLETQWGENFLRVKSISGDKVAFQDTEANILFQRPNPRLENGEFFHWENSRGFITQPGEWALDTSTQTVYYLPRPGEDLTTAAVTAPALETLVDVSGASLDSPASNISFSGLTFTGTTWTRPSNSGYLNAQGGNYNLTSNNQNQQTVGRPPAAVHVSNASNISFAGNTFTNTGATALDLDRGTRDSVVVGNVISGGAGNGIVVGKFSDPSVEYHSPYDPPNTPAGSDAREVASGNTVSNNLITRIGLDYYGTAGINAGWTSGTTITHNEISDVPWAGISVGWGWQHTAGAAKNNTVTNNEVSNAINKLCDTGGIYHLSVDPGSTYSNNYVHDVVRTPAACTNPFIGLYFDEGSDQLTAANNVVENVENIVGQNQNGSNVTFSNNTAAGKSVIQAAGLESAYRGLRAKVDIAQGKATSASSTYSGALSSGSAADGNPSTGWSASASDTNSWWQVDLGASVPLDQIQVLSRQDVDQPETRTGFSIQASNDATFASYTTIGRVSGRTVPDAGSVSLDVTTSAPFRYVRVQKIDGRYFYIADVRVLAAQGAIGTGPVVPSASSTAFYTLTNVNSGLVADINAASTADGAALQQYTSLGGTNQQWRIVPAGGGLYTIVNRNSGKLLDVQGASVSRGASVVQRTANGSNNQLWYFEAAPNGAFVIRSFQSKQALEVAGNTTVNGGGIDQWAPLNQSNQYWSIAVAPN